VLRPVYFASRRTSELEDWFSRAMSIAVVFNRFESNYRPCERARSRSVYFCLNKEFCASLFDVVLLLFCKRRAKMLRPGAEEPVSCAMHSLRALIRGRSTELFIKIKIHRAGPSTSVRPTARSKLIENNYDSRRPGKLQVRTFGDSQNIQGRA